MSPAGQGCGCVLAYGQKKPTGQGLQGDVGGEEHDDVKKPGGHGTQDDRAAVSLTILLLLKLKQPEQQPQSQMHNDDEVIGGGAVEDAKGAKEVLGTNEVM